MKTVAILFFIGLIATTAQAQNTTEVLKVTTIEMSAVTETKAKLNLNETTTVARLYKFKNARVTKALSFRTKRDATKIV